ncbi:MAG: hypothetical protein ABIB43_04610 [archaeon]
MQIKVEMTGPLKYKGINLGHTPSDTTYLDDLTLEFENEKFMNKYFTLKKHFSKNINEAENYLQKLENHPFIKKFLSWSIYKPASAVYMAAKNVMIEDALSEIDVIDFELNNQKNADEFLEKEFGKEKPFYSNETGEA